MSYKTTSKTVLQNKANIPNENGFEFWAVMKDGTIIEDKVIKNQQGLHSCEHFKTMIGWLRKK